MTADEGEKLISEGKIAAGVYGWFWIANPDFAKRLESGKELNNDVNFVGLYGGGLPRDEESQATGYSDYPFAK